MKRISLSAITLLLLLAPVACWARGGGGCLLEGTPVLTPSGPIPIQRLTVGAPVWCAAGGELRLSWVETLTEVYPKESLEISAAGVSLRVTPEHPLMVGPGEYRMAGHIKVGDMVFLAGNGRTEAVRVEAIRKFLSEGPAFNLLVSPGGTFIAGGFVVHNKGCFLPDSPILKPDGTEIQISAVRPGEKLLAFTPEGRLVNAEVLNIIRHEVDEYLLLKTDRQTVRVTKEHPFYVGNGAYKTLEALKVGDTLVAWDGQSLAEQRIVSLERVCERTPVYNLQTDQPNTFFAGHLAVHNKGGGCFPKGTQITTPQGTVPIEGLAPGDEILGVKDDGCTVRATVKSLLLAKGRVLKIETDHETVTATDEHPIGLWEGGFKEAGRLEPGDRIRQWKDGRYVMVTVHVKSVEADKTLVLNLQVSSPHTFIAENTLVHNKGGGCFPAGTLIRTPQGQTAIERLSPGDQVSAIDPDGRLVHAMVESIYATQSPVLVIETDRGTLRTTDEHPLARPDGTFSPAGEVKPKDRVLAHAKGLLRSARVGGVFAGDTDQQVYNLTVASPHTFVADSFIVHNKGGGGYHSSGSSRSGGGGGSGAEAFTPMDFLIALLILGIPLAVMLISSLKGRRSKSENLDFVYGKKEVARKAEKTEKLLGFLSQQDSSVSPGDLRKRVESTFLKLQECWEKRDYEPMKPLLMSALFNQHLAQIQGIIRNHEINRLENLKVENISLVNARYTEKPDHREFTALISASVKDYYVDDRTGKFLRGDKTPAKFQEFWTFHRVKDQWLLREVEQAGESDYLKDENFAETLTDDTVQGIYREAAKEGVAGPWLGKGEEKKADRTERLLNFLVQTDKLWDRTQMLERARAVFLSVYLARESGDPDQVPTDLLFPEVAESLRKQMQEWQSDGLRVEYRNLCVRKAELILVRNFSVQSNDEFSVRIDAHAQKLVRKGETIFSEQEYVTPFEEFWTFGRRLAKWKLKEVLPPARGKRLVEEENVDEESSPGQLEWYYRQTRAT